MDGQNIDICPVSKLLPDFLVDIRVLIFGSNLLSVDNTVLGNRKMRSPLWTPF